MADTPSPPRRRALVVGIDDYPYIYALPLKGCRNDARRMSALLRDRFGFEVLQLLDREATREGLLVAMEELEQSLLPEDRVLFHFSGHGSRIIEPSGQAFESLLPQDSGRGEYPNRDLLDRELFAWISRLNRKTPYVTLVMDSCHSGGVVRNLRSGVRGVEADHRPGAAAEKRGWLDPREAPAEALRSGSRDIGSSGWLPWSDRFTLIAACRAQESAREMEDPATGDSHGALTYYLSESLTKVEGRLSYRDLFEPISMRIQARFREQSPQLEGAWDREFFGDQHLAPMRFAPVRARSGRTVELEAGAAQGLTQGTECEVYAQGTRRAEGEPLGRLRIESLRLLNSSAKLLEEKVLGAVDAGARAVEVARPESAARLPVRLLGPERGIRQIRGLVASSPLLEVAPNGHGAAYAVHLLAPRKTAEADDPVAQVGAVDWPLWAVVDASGRLVMPPKSASAPEAAEQVLTNLEIWARYQALLELSQASLGAPLDCPLQIELCCRSSDGSWSPAKPEADGRLIYHSGEQLGIRFRHGHDAPLHLAILDLGLTGSIHLLHPARGRSRPVPGLSTLEVGMDEEDPIDLSIPEELPYPGETFEEARETLIFLFSTEEADLSLLSQSGVRGILAGTRRSETLEPRPEGQPAGSLARALHLALAGPGSRDARARSQRGGGRSRSRVEAASFWLRRST